MSRHSIAVAYGLVCHGLFALAVTAMALGLSFGMTTGQGTLVGFSAYVGNAILVLQFPILHSLMLSKRGRGVYRWLAPRRYLPTLSSTLYASFASLQVLLMFALWSPMTAPFWVATGGWATLSWTLCAAAWLLLGKSMFDANLALQTGALGWLALLRGRTPDYGPFPTGGLFAVCRQPIYLAFALITWMGPVWTVDRVLVGTTLTAYCVWGPLLKERRFATIHGAPFHEYQQRVPYLPLFPRQTA